MTMGATLLFPAVTPAALDYLRAARPLGIAGGAVVSGSFQAFDQSYLADALARLGEGFVGVTQLPATVSDEEVLRLHGAGVRALRFNVKRGGSAGLEDVPSLARRVHELAGWHVEFYIDSAELDALHPMLRTLPRFSIDHLGLSRRGFATLLKLAEQGARVKATGFGRLDFDVAQALRDLAARQRLRAGGYVRAGGGGRGRAGRRRPGHGRRLVERAARPDHPRPT